MNTIKQGIGFGVGSTQYRVVGGVADAVSGGGGDSEERTEEQQTYSSNDQQQGPCFEPPTIVWLSNTNNGDAQACQWFFDSLNVPRK